MHTLKLYVVGNTARALAAEAALERAFSEELEGRFALEVIDVLRTPDAGGAVPILATPTLRYETEDGVKSVVGDMADVQRVLSLLGLA